MTPRGSHSSLCALMRRYRAAAFVLVMAAAAARGGPVLAQSPSPTPPPRRPQPVPFATDPLSVSADLVDAMRLVQTNPDAAVALLHRLNARYPNRDDIMARLGYALQVAEKPDSAEYYYRAALNANPLNLDAGKALGSIYFNRGDEPRAMQVFNGLLEANDHNLAAYRIVAGALRDLGRPDEAIVVLQQGRDRARASDSRGRNVGPFTFEIAASYKQMGDSRRAMDEYLDYTAAQPGNFRFVRDKMIEVLRDDDKNRDALVSYMKTRAEKGGAGSFVAADVLAAHYLEQGMLESSLEMALRADEDKLSDGASLLSIGEDAVSRADMRPRAERGRYYDLALRALEAYTKRRPQAPMMDKALYLLGGVYAAYGSGVSATVLPADRAGYLERAVGEYAAVSKQFAGGEYAEDAYVQRGDVLLRKLKRPKDALDVYKTGALTARRDITMCPGRMAEVYIATGEPGDTEHYLQSLMHSDRPELAQEGQYYVGVNLATQHKYEAARDTLTALAEKAPFSPFTNDAIALAWVLQEGTELKSQSLEDYTASLKADLAGDTTEVVTHLQNIVARTADDPLRPRALRELGAVLFETGDYDGSIAVLRRFLQEYPEDDDCAAAQRSIGRTYEIGLGRYADALKEYEHILVAYPDYAMLDDVRHDVERVRASTQGAGYAQ